MSASQPTVSVLVTVYNREKYLADALRSIQAQTFQDYEVVLCDNQSTDKSLEIARAMAAEDPRIRVTLNESNLGQFGNRNRVARLARGEFLKYHDSDDIMYPHCLETMVSALRTFPTAGFAASSGWAWPGGPCPMLLTPRMCYLREFLGQGMFNLGPSCAMFRREVLLGLGGFEDKGVGSDNIFWLKACAKHSVALVSADLFWYRLHPDQEYVTDKAAREYAIVHGEEWRALHSEECPLSVGEREIAKRKVAFHLAKALRRDLKARKFALAKTRLRHSGLTLSDWLCYLRRPPQDTMMGTPVTEKGEFVMPAWLSCVKNEK